MMWKALVGIAAVAAIGVGGWVGWQAHDASVRWGTTDPCQMIGNRLARNSIPDAQVMVSPERLRERLTIAANYAGTAREDGTLACWRSVLLDQPLLIEQIAHDLEWAASIKKWWADPNPALHRHAIAMAEGANERVREAVGLGHPIWQAIEDEHAH